MVPETVFKANRQVRVKCPSYTEVNDLRSSYFPFQSLKCMQINAICKIFGLSDFLDVKVRLNVSIPQLNILTPTYLQFQYIMFKDVYRETLTVYRSPPSQLSILIDYIRYFSIIKPNIIISTISLQITRPSLYIGKDKYEKLLTQ